MSTHSPHRFEGHRPTVRVCTAAIGVLLVIASPRLSAQLPGPGDPIILSATVDRTIGSPSRLIIQGANFPAAPIVLLGANVLPIVSASGTQIVAGLSISAPGTYRLWVFDFSNLSSIKADRFELTLAGAQPPCFGAPPSSARYYDCGNGTVTDTVTGLVWLKNAACLGVTSYLDANRAASLLGDGQCGLSDGSRPGDWRLATKAEWDATVHPARDLFHCTPSSIPLTKDDGFTCFGDGSGSSFTSVTAANYWTSSTFEFGGTAYLVQFFNGAIPSDGRGAPAGSWPVRAR